MRPNEQLVRELYWERVLRARRMSSEEKLLAGPQLFELACRITMEGIRHQFPDADESRVRQILNERLAWRRSLEERGLYRLGKRAP